MSRELRDLASDEITEYLSEAMRICGRAYELKNEIQLLLLQVPNLNVHDPELENLIRDIRDDKKFLSVSQYESMASFFNERRDDPNESWEVDAQDRFVQSIDGSPGVLLRPTDYKFVKVFR